MPSGGARHYDDEEVEAILRRALERQLEAGEKLGHDDLVAAAREVGLDEGSVARAIHEIEAERTAQDIRIKLRRHRRARWTRHLVAYLAIAGGLVALNVLALAGPWVLWIAVLWGMIVALQAYNGFRATTEAEVERELHRRNRHARRKAQAEARREAKRRHAEERARREEARRHRRDAGGELERVIEEGVSLLLNAAANKLRDATTGVERAPRTEFEQYVARKKGQGGVTPPAGAPPKRDTPRVRVEAEEELDDELESSTSRRRRSSRKR